MHALKIKYSRSATKSTGRTREINALMLGRTLEERSSIMACVDLPCDFEQWAEYKNLFIMLYHLRSIDDLKLFIGSYTRSDTPPSATASCLNSLRGLVVFLTDNFGWNEQKKFMRTIFPFIAKSAALLEERVPVTGLPFLERQESKQDAQLVNYKWPLNWE